MSISQANSDFQAHRNSRRHGISSRHEYQLSYVMPALSRHIQRHASSFIRQIGASSHAARYQPEIIGILSPPTLPRHSKIIDTARDGTRWRHVGDRNTRRARPQPPSPRSFLPVLRRLGGIVAAEFGLSLDRSVDRRAAHAHYALIARSRRVEY